MKAYSYVRFSTPEQERGDSLRRQVEQSDAYCRAHGLTLDDTLRLTDRGLSAFHGFHRTKGALGEFHRLVEEGEVKPGAILLVESLDRLSREQVLDALTQFTGLIQAGIKVVTLADHMEYGRDSINANFGQLLLSLVIMSRAHEESVIKALRGRKAWEQKRKQAVNNGHKMTAKCPGWLRLSDDRRSFQVLPEVAQAVKWIFQMKLEGKGSEAIVRALNEKQGTWKPNGKRNPGGWRKSYIEKIIRSRAVIGEYQAHKKSGCKRVPEGDPIPNYFPAIIDKDQFDRVQAMIQQNQRTCGNAGGRNGPVNNLFGHIAKCGECGSPMAYINKGASPKGGSYLVCDSARRGLGCKKSYLRYDKFEPLILTYCKGLDPSEILPESMRIQSELSMLRNQMQAGEGEIVRVQRKIANLVDSLEDTDNPEDVKPIKDRIRELQGQKMELEARQEALTRQINETASISQDAEKQLQDVRDLIDRMSQLEGHERINIRLNLRSQLRRLIYQMNFFPEMAQVGMRFKTGEGRLLIVEEERVDLLDVLPHAKKRPAQLWEKPF